MSGPDLPRQVPGSNAIGSFAIGVSAVGTYPPAFDVWDTVISQYANSVVLTTLILNFAGYIDPTEDLDAFFDLIWNVDTAQGYGLDVWGRIVGVTRTLQVPTGRFFGFEEGGTQDYDPFGQSPLYSGIGLTSNYALSDNAYRMLIFAKALANISDNSIPMLNQMLLNLFPHRGNCYVAEGQERGDWFGFAESINASGFNQAPFYSGLGVARMMMTYTFEFSLSPVEFAIVAQSGVLPKPAGVKATVLQIP